MKKYQSVQKLCPHFCRDLQKGPKGQNVKNELGTDFVVLWVLLEVCEMVEQESTPFTDFCTVLLL